MWDAAQDADVGRSEGADALGLGALGALADLELDALVLFQAAEAVALDLRVVHEDVSAAAVWGDEAEALLRVEPLDRALCHVLSPRQVVETDRQPYGGPGRPGDGNLRQPHLEEDHAPATSRLASVVKHEHKTDDHR